MNCQNPANQRRQKGSDNTLGKTNEQKHTSELVSCGKFFLASITGFAVLIYAIGYLCQVGHHKMLGITEVEYASEKVIFDGICFFILSPFCILLSLFVSWQSWVILLLLTVSLLSQRLMARRFQRKLQTVVVWVVRVVVLFLITVLFIFLSGMVCSQGDLLLATQPSGPESYAAWFNDLTSYSLDLPMLLESGQSKSLYGLLLLLAAVCFCWWVRNFVNAICRSPLSEETSRLRKTLRRAFLVLSLYLILLLVALVLCLYGFLVKSNDYPIIEVEDSKAGHLSGETLFVLGHYKSHTLLYSLEGQEPKIWWVESTFCQPASQSQPPKNLFKCLKTWKIKETKASLCP